jgi:DNA replication protein DnaC
MTLTPLDYQACRIPEKFSYQKNESLVKFIKGSDQSNEFSRLWVKVNAHIREVNIGELPPKGLALIGSQGSGKSTAMWAIARAALDGFYAYKTSLFEQRRDGYSGIPRGNKILHPFGIRKFSDILREIPPTEERDTWDHGLALRLAQRDIIFIDDLTLDPQDRTYSWARRFVFELMDSLTDRLPGTFALYLTSNNKYEELETLLGAQTADRIRELCEPVICKWKSLR